MKIQYNLKFKDYLSYCSWHQLLSIRYQMLHLVVAFFSAYSFVKIKGLLVGFIFMMIIYIFLWLFQLVLNLLFLISNKNKSLITEHTIEILEEAFLEETTYNKSYHYWPGTIRLSTYPGLVVVYVSANGAHIIPNRAFNSKQQREEFINAIRQKLQSA